MRTDESSGVLPIFATPFASIDTGTSDEFNDRLARLCESQRRDAESRGNRSRDPLHFRGSANLLEVADEPASELKEVMLGSASRLVASIASFGAEPGDLRVDARAWCSIVQPNGYVPAQHFTGASWVAVYCVQRSEPDERTKDAGILRIHETRLSSVFRDASTWEAKQPYRYGHYSWVPRPGWMALFPAHVQHEVSLVRSSTPLILVYTLLRFLDAQTRDSRYG